MPARRCQDHCAPPRGWMEAAGCHHTSTARRGRLMQARRGHHAGAGSGPAAVQGQAAPRPPQH
eukprot:4333547-Prorocentrum_lima.AAC.1